MARRKNRIIFVATDKELKQIKEKAKQEELTVSEYLRLIAIHGEVK